MVHDTHATHEWMQGQMCGVNFNVHNLRISTCYNNEGQWHKKWKDLRLTLRGFEMPSLHWRIGPTRLFSNSFHLIGEIWEVCKV